MPPSKQVRIRSNKKARNLPNDLVRVLLIEYVTTGVTQKSLGQKYGIDASNISRLVSGALYRDVPGISELRKQAQSKASARSSKWTGAEAMRVPDPTATVIEVDFNSIDSVTAAILRLLEAHSQLLGSPSIEPEEEAA